MSFGKLLAAGRSFVGGQGVGRYRLNPGARLPKFISPKNPFAQPPKDAVVQTVSSEAPAQNLPNQDADTGARAASVNSFSKDAARVSVRSKFRIPFVGGARKLNPLQLFSRRRAKPRSAEPRVDEKPVQGELSLERVRVVRNDLADADLDGSSPGGVRGGRKPSPGEGAWGRLSARVFGTETT